MPCPNLTYPAYSVLYFFSLLLLRFYYLSSLHKKGCEHHRFFYWYTYYSFWNELLRKPIIIGQLMINEFFENGRINNLTHDNSHTHDEVIPELVKLTKHGSVGDAVCSHVLFSVFHTTGVKAYTFLIRRRECELIVSGCNSKCGGPDSAMSRMSLIF